jgi:hypothetical protein
MTDLVRIPSHLYSHAFIIRRFRRRRPKVLERDCTAAFNVRLRGI